MSATYRLSEHTYIEPLVNHWMAWWLTLAPIPACLNAYNFQLPLLKAYLQNPAFHEKSEREINGGSFVGVPASRAAEVRALLQRTQTGQEEGLKLAEAFEEFQTYLWTEAKGQSLEPLYQKLPPSLRGLVELVYDYNNRASIQVLEPLSYKSRFHQPQLQALQLGALERDSERRTFFTTPRLTHERQIEWKVPFTDARVDPLFELERTPQPLGHIQELLGDAVPNEEVLRSLLTEAPAPAPVETWTGPGVRVRYVGHACVLVEWKGTSILIDPVIGVRPRAGGESRLSYEDLPARIDYALVTHAHADHYNPETLLRLRRRIDCLVVPRARGLLVGDVSLKLMSTMMGYKRVVDMEMFDSLPLPDGEIVAIPFLGEHGDLSHAKSAYLIRAGKEQILFAADSANLDDTLYRNIRQAVGEVQTVFMNTENEGSPLTFTIDALFPKRRDRRAEKNRRCRGSNASEGVRLLELLGAKRLYNYAMGLEPWLSHIVGPEAPADSPRMKESDTLLTEARTRGLEVAHRLRGTTELRIATEGQP
ncbi:Beta-lactamase superfamily domain-containing protein [Stigmatella aurantiaca]|uniref:Beta-lactamase superfamily domain-containing protein n=1 Tax=Stigmatella aurantiaca TaxID=41 RepID=A0A1H8EJX6_STIAU|nr:MBL fold metallo-hydrolase [Stigmatella aurantiaca]SEN19098.1 Beta-lactamase superfamily domain-containing protein [Stigmatella aurantiaca]